ncbi:MAG: threonylcarbamoyl-AMP synthase [Bacteroidetes bacterium]|nr:threonylcarbamoyl-AMP synthase [Bacteroidota bacterium]
MLLQIHPVDPQARLIRQAVDILRNGGVVIYPTDTIYGIGCDILQPKAIDRICRLKGIEPHKANLSFICNDLSHLSEFAKPIATPTFRILKKHLPGPYTFILPASNMVPRVLQSNKSTIGLRIPDHPIALALVRELGRPILSTSLPGDQVEDTTDPDVMYENYGNQVEAVIDGGPGGTTPSTVVDCTSNVPMVIREGAGEWVG